jgi:hypothetical protein
MVCVVNMNLNQKASKDLIILGILFLALPYASISLSLDEGLYWSITIVIAPFGHTNAQIPHPLQ